MRAGEKLAAASRYHEAQLSRSSNARQPHVSGSNNIHNKNHINAKVNTNNVDGYGICNRSEKSSSSSSSSSSSLTGQTQKQGHFVSAVDRRRAAFAIQASASSMRVCWALMGPTLHRIKSNNTNNKSIAEAAPAKDSTKTIPSSSGDRGHGHVHPSTHRDDSCKNKNGRVGGSHREAWDDDDVDDVGITKVTAGSLLAGLCEKAFQPAISLSFRPPAPN